MEPIASFKVRAGVDKLQFLKGKGREFCPTSLGTLFMAKNFSASKDAFILVNDGSTNPALKGSLWVVNMGATAATVL